jgi:peptidoglycan/LPS O-acetylase OafA/YrhL
MQDTSIGIGYTSAPLAALGFEAGFTKSALIGVGWTISIELFFYAIMVVLLPLLKRSPERCMAVILGMCALGSSAVVFKQNIVHPTISHMFSFTPIFIIGMSIYFYWSDRIKASTAVIYGVASFATYILCTALVHPMQLDPSAMYTAQIVYATAIFLSAIWMNGKQLINNGPITKFFANVSYSLYLTHVPLSVFLAYILFPVLGLTGAMLVSFVACVALSYAMYRLIEKPAQKIGRKLLSKHAQWRGLSAA